MALDFCFMLEAKTPVKFHNKHLEMFRSQSQHAKLRHRGVKFFPIKIIKIKFFITKII